MDYQIEAIPMTLSDLKVCHPLQTFSNKNFRTVLQQLTIFQQT